MPTSTPKKAASPKTKASTAAEGSPKTRASATTGRSPATSGRRGHARAKRGGASEPQVPQVFGRCGGREIISRLEREVCDRLTTLGVTHSHRPRHFEVTLGGVGPEVDLSDAKAVAAAGGTLGAYAPEMVLRGRGREGKTVVVETLEHADDPKLDKIRAFRRQYGAEFYVCLVAPEEVLDEVHFDTYDEAAATTDLHTLVGRLAD